MLYHTAYICISMCLWNFCESFAFLCMSLYFSVTGMFCQFHQSHENVTDNCCALSTNLLLCTPLIIFTWIIYKRIRQGAHKPTWFPAPFAPVQINLLMKSKLQHNWVQYQLALSVILLQHYKRLANLIALWNQLVLISDYCTVYLIGVHFAEE